MKRRKLARREFLIQATAAAGTVAAASSRPGRAAPSAKQPPSVMLLIADDHGLDALGCYGNDVIQTPNLDRLASEGVRFTQAYCTTASCSASRSVILTGLYNHANGQYGHAHSFHHFVTHPWVRPLPRLLRDHGYATGVVGKLHVNPEEQYGFDFQGKASSRNVLAMAKDARRFVEQCDGRPFYLHIGYSDPHRAEQGFANEKKYPGVKAIKYSPDKVRVPAFLPDRPEVRAELAEYCQSVSRLDQGVGMMMEMLRETGRDRDTLVIYISDNGIAFPGAKTTLYDPGIHLPMIVRSPFHSGRGLVNNAMTTWADLAPTILKWTGAKPPDYPLHGRSWLKILEEENPSGWDEIYFSHTFHEITMYYPSRGIRTRHHKYIHNLYPEVPFPHASDLLASPTWQGLLKRGEKMYGPRSVEAYLHRPLEEIYDLEKDPDEVRNVAGDPKYANVLAELRRKTVAFRKRTQDGWLGVHNQPRKPLPG
ncbi:hypothetical protein AMJ85_05500 [candidate division BRC1 bacterium SM23_51]|nr:MAG: hypothetical protein AMJ85_05500 [candidate division BRC1 bacterium SM23_51]